MKKNTIYTIVAVAVLLVTVFVATIAVGLVDNPLSPNHFVGTWQFVTAEGYSNMLIEEFTFQRPMMGQWGRGTMTWIGGSGIIQPGDPIPGHVVTPFMYKYTDAKLILQDIPSGSKVLLDYSFSNDYNLLTVTVRECAYTLMKV